MTLPALALPLGLVLAGVVAGLAVRLMLVRLGRLATGSRTRVDDLAVGVLRGPVVLWGVIVGLYAAADVMTLTPVVESLIQKTLLVLVILSVSWTAARLVTGWVRRSAVAGQNALGSASLIANLAGIIVLGIGVLVILQTLGISITPIITALGVGGLAVALALQDTLANLFAGVHILATRQLRPGDFIRLESGDEGYIDDITWRNTTIRRLPNDMVIVPNAKLAGAVTINYSLPETEEAVLVNVGVSYASDLGQVERVTVEVARDIQREVEGAVREFVPFIRYNALADSSINFSVILRGRDVVAQHLIRHEFIKRLHARYQREAIQIPFPQRTLHLAESAGELRNGLTPPTGG
jgi:small-conductance mechanosensitive channel